MPRICARINAQHASVVGLRLDDARLQMILAFWEATVGAKRSWGGLGRRKQHLSGCVLRSAGRINSETVIRLAWVFKCMTCAALFNVHYIVRRPICSRFNDQHASVVGLRLDDVRLQMIFVFWEASLGARRSWGGLERRWQHMSGCVLRSSTEHCQASGN